MKIKMHFFFLFKFTGLGFIDLWLMCDLWAGFPGLFLWFGLGQGHCSPFNIAVVSLALAGNQSFWLPGSSRIFGKLKVLIDT